MPDSDHAEVARAAYDAGATDYIRVIGTDINSATEGPIDQALLVAFARLVAGTAAGRVADIGCGPGRAAALLATHGIEVIGVDVSRAMLALARSAHPGIGVAQGTIEALPIGSGALAGAVCWYSIIHTPPGQLARVVGELVRTLARGGFLLLAFQSGSGEPVHRRSQSAGARWSLTSYRHSVHEVTRCLEEVGLSLYAKAERTSHLAHETSPQAFVVARRP